MARQVLHGGLTGYGGMPVHRGRHGYLALEGDPDPVPLPSPIAAAPNGPSVLAQIHERRTRGHTEDGDPIYAWSQRGETWGLLTTQRNETNDRDGRTKVTGVLDMPVMDDDPPPKETSMVWTDDGWWSVDKVNVGTGRWLFSVSRWD